MIHLAALGIGLVVLTIAWLIFYGIHKVIEFFGMDTEDVILFVGVTTVAIVFSWFLGTIALELMGLHPNG